MAHLQNVATGFRLFGATVGISSFVAFLLLAWAWMSAQVAAPAPPMPGESTSLITVLMSGARLFGRVFAFASEISRWVLSVLAAGALLVSLFSAGVYVTGRGLDEQQTWARIAGALLATMVAAASCLGLLSFRRGLFGLISAGMLAGASYTLWTLWKKFA